MIAPLDVSDRLEHLQLEYPGLKLYGLLDGAQYLERTGKRFNAQPGAEALFWETPDAALAFAGPWLLDTASADSALLQELVGLERSTYGVSWLIAYQDLRGLAQLLRLNLETELPDGRTALVRFWDPRVLAGLAEVLTPEQRQEFCGHIFEWHLLLNREQRVRIGRQGA
ncbi:DUF4123 domain-containing protein [Pseudoduganella sp. HUAS MS19]